MKYCQDDCIELIMQNICSHYHVTDFGMLSSSTIAASDKSESALQEVYVIWAIGETISCIKSVRKF